MDKIKIRMISPTKNKLQFVKLIKQCSGLGLRESKDLCDNLHSMPNKFLEMPLYAGPVGSIGPARSSQYIEESYSYNDSYMFFCEGMKSIDGEFQFNGGHSFDRNLKMLSLGIGDNYDYASFIVDDILMYSNKNEIINIFEKLPEDQLKMLFSELSLKYLKK